MNVDRRWWGTSVVGVRILVAGLVLLGAGCAVLGWGTRFGKSIRHQDHVLQAGGTLASPQSREAGTWAGSSAQSQAQSILAGLPLIFEPNLGQANLDPADGRVQFVSHAAGYSLALGSEGALLTLVSHAPKAGSRDVESRAQTFQMKIAGAASPAHFTGADLLPGKSNYLIGNNPAKWRTGIPQFAGVRYENVYPGIDLVFYGNQGHLEYDFQVAPGADPSRTELEFGGAKKLELKNGALVIRGENGGVELQAPRVYQEVDGHKQPVEGAFVLRAENRVGFTVGAYDHSRELVIDPILNFASYFGGTGDEHHTSIAVDGSLNIYISGSTTSPGLTTACFPVGGCSGLRGAQNAYIAKIQPPLKSVPARLALLTYLGGTGTDYPVGIAVDGAGDPYVAGTTTSGDFPTLVTTAYQSTPNPANAGTRVFVTKLKFDFTSLLYSSYLSGNGTDIATGMTIDSEQDLYVTGTTTSVEAATSSDQFPASHFPTLGYQLIPHAAAGTPQFFVTKVNTILQGSASIPYSTYFGGGTFSGTAVAVGGGIAVDNVLNNIYFTGTTNFVYTGLSPITDFPILNAYQPCLDTAPPSTVVFPQTCTSSGSAADAFVAKLNPSVSQGQQLVWSTYLGGSGDDSGVGVALDTGAANVYVVGTTDSPDFFSNIPAKNFAPYQACLNNITITPATGNPTCAQQTTTPPANDAFVARISNPTIVSGSNTTVALGYFSYLGGVNDEAGTAITVDSNSGAVITGSTNSPSSFTLSGTAYQPNPGTFPIFPFPGSIQGVLNNSNPQCSATPCNSDAFFARLNTGATTGQTTTASWATYYGGSGNDLGTGIALDVNQSPYVAGETSSPDLNVPLGFQTTYAGGASDSFLAQLAPKVSLSISGVANTSSGQQYFSAGTPATFTYTVTNGGPDLATNVAILADFAQAGVPVSNVSATISSGTCGAGGTSTAISCGPVSLQSGSTATVTITLTPGSVANATSFTPFNGGTVFAIGPENIVLAQTSVPALMSDFTMSVSPRNVAVPVAGATATYTVQLNPLPVYAASITVSCSGLPAASTCSPKTVSLLNASGASVGISVTTTARPVTTPTASLFTRRFYALWLMIPGMALVGVGGNRRRRRICGFLMLCALFTLVLLIPACSSSKTTTPAAGTPAGNYTLTITAAAGSDSKSQTVVLTVP